MKKICHLTSVHKSNDARIFSKQCASLAKNGYDVTIVANDGIRGVFEGVKIESVDVPFKSRYERMTKVVKAVYQKALEIDADIYELHDPELFRIMPGLKKKGKAVIFDSHEDYVSNIKGKTWIPRIFRGLVVFIYKLKEKSALKKIDAVIGVTPKQMERLQSIQKNCYMITNYPKLEEIQAIESTKKEPWISFAGVLSEKWMHGNIIKALEKFDNLRYQLIVRGQEDAYMKALQSLPAGSKVDVRYNLTRQEVMETYSKSLAGVAIYDYDASIYGNIGSLGATKIFEIMGSGLPLICSDFLLWKEIVEKHRCGICVNPRKPDEIASAIAYILDKPEEAAQMGNRGRTAVLEEFNWSTEETKLLKLYRNLEE